MTGETTTQEVEHAAPVARLTRDLRKAAEKMGKAEIRFMVDGYYEIQNYRTASSNQVRTAKEAGEPAAILSYIADQARTLENQIRGALDRWTMAQKVGKWMRSHKGIGPVITAGMLAHIDIKKAPTAGHIYSFAGLNPNAKWGKGQKRPWNARLKVLCCVPGQMATTRRGAIPIEEVVVGDEVLTHKGRWRRVTQVFVNDYAGEVHNLVARGHGGVGPTLTDGHPVVVRSHELMNLSGHRWKRKATKQKVRVAETAQAISTLEATGMNGRSIAAKLGLSDATVSHYRAGHRTGKAPCEIGWMGAHKIERGRDDVSIPVVPPLTRTHRPPSG